jgi:hypothetical protein
MSLKKIDLTPYPINKGEVISEQTVSHMDPRQAEWRAMILNLMTPSVRKQWLKTEAELLQLEQTEKDSNDSGEEKSTECDDPVQSFPEEKAPVVDSY